MGLARGFALAVVSFIDFYTAKSLSLVTYVHPHQVDVVQALEASMSVVCAIGVLGVLISWPFLLRETHRRFTLGVLVILTEGMALDVFALLLSALVGQRARASRSRSTPPATRAMRNGGLGTWTTCPSHSRRQAPWDRRKRSRWPC